MELLMGYVSDKGGGYPLLSQGYHYHLEASSARSRVGGLVVAFYSYNLSSRLHGFLKNLNWTVLAFFTNVHEFAWKSIITNLLFNRAFVNYLSLTVSVVVVVDAIMSVVAGAVNAVVADDFVLT